MSDRCKVTISSFALLAFLQTSVAVKNHVMVAIPKAHLHNQTTVGMSSLVQANADMKMVLCGYLLQQASKSCHEGVPDTPHHPQNSPGSPRVLRHELPVMDHMSNMSHAIGLVKGTLRQLGKRRSTITMKGP